MTSKARKELFFAEKSVDDLKQLIKSFKMRQLVVDGSQLVADSSGPSAETVGR